MRTAETHGCARMCVQLCNEANDSYRNVLGNAEQNGRNSN